MTPPPSAGHWFESDPLWFKHAVFTLYGTSTPHAVSHAEISA